MSAMGALNANVFATAILCVTASRRGYFPRIFANMHYARGTSESDYYRRVLRNWPAMIRNANHWFRNDDLDPAAGKKCAHVRDSR